MSDKTINNIAAITNENPPSAGASASFIKAQNQKAKAPPIVQTINVKIGIRNDIDNL